MTFPIIKRHETQPPPSGELMAIRLATFQRLWPALIAVAIITTTAVVPTLSCGSACRPNSDSGTVASDWQIQSLRRSSISVGPTASCMVANGRVNCWGRVHMQCFVSYL